MSTNCTIYRSNRITPIYTLLNSTCFLLGDCFTREAELFWETGTSPDLQYGAELERFGRFLKQRLQSGAICNPLLEEVLDFELATYALQFSPRRQILRDLERAATAGADGPARLHPLVRIVRFRHDPAEILRRVAAREPPPYDLAEGDFFVLLSMVDGSLQVKGVAADLGIQLLTLQRSGWEPLSVEEVRPLVAVGLVITTAEANAVVQRRDEL